MLERVKTSFGCPTIRFVPKTGRPADEWRFPHDVVMVFETSALQEGRAVRVDFLGVAGLLHASASFGSDEVDRRFGADSELALKEHVVDQSFLDFVVGPGRGDRSGSDPRSALRQFSAMFDEVGWLWIVAEECVVREFSYVRRQQPPHPSADSDAMIAAADELPTVMSGLSHNRLT